MGILELSTTISTGVSLFAFLATLIVLFFQKRAAARLKELNALSKKDRLQRLKDDENPYGLNLQDIPDEDRVRIAERILIHKEKQFRTALFSGIIVFALAFGITVVQILSKDEIVTQCDELLDRGSAHLAADRHTEAIDYFSRATSECAKSDWRPSYKLGNVYFYRGYYAQAAEQHKNALILNPNDTDIIYRLALDLDGTGDYEEAIKILESGLHADNSLRVSTEFRYDIGLNYLLLAHEHNPPDLSDAENAAEHFKAALSTATEPRHWFNFGLACALAIQRFGTIEKSRIDRLTMLSMQHFDTAMNELDNYKSKKAPLQREMMASLWKNGSKWVTSIRRPGEPAHCPSLVKLIESIKKPSELPVYLTVSS